MEVGVVDLHSKINDTNIEHLDKTFVCGANPIDTIAISEGIGEFAEGGKVLGNNEIVFTDHRACLLDVNLDEYFNDALSS